ncbi:hypothetical protein ACJZ2D_014227 [Fusarium nematophilum]
MALPKRIVKETERLMAEPVPGISAVPHEDNLRYFDVEIHGPAQSPYEGGIFKLELFLPDDYPMTPPKIRFLTKIFHPNVDKLGRICLDVLKNNWSPALQIRTILLSIQALLGAPNPDDPLAADVAKSWKEDEQAAIATAKEWTANSASVKPKLAQMSTWGSDSDATTMGTLRKEDDYAESFGLLSSTNKPLFQLLGHKAGADTTKVGLALKVAANSPPYFKQKPHRIVYTTESKDGLTFSTADVIVAAPGDEGYLAVHLSSYMTQWMTRGEMETICNNLNDLSCRIPPTVWQALTESEQQSVILDGISLWGAKSEVTIRHLADLTLDKAAGPEVGSATAQMHVGQPKGKSVASDGASTQKEAKLHAKIDELTSQVKELALSLTQLQSKQGPEAGHESPQVFVEPAPWPQPRGSSSNKPKPWTGDWESPSSSTPSWADVNSNASTDIYWNPREVVRTPDTLWGEVPQYKPEDVNFWGEPTPSGRAAESNTQRVKKRASQKQHVEHANSRDQFANWEVPVW